MVKGGFSRLDFTEIYENRKMKIIIYFYNITINADFFLFINCKYCFVGFIFLQIFLEWVENQKISGKADNESLNSAVAAETAKK